MGPPPSHVAPPLDSCDCFLLTYMKWSTCKSMYVIIVLFIKFPFKQFHRFISVLFSKLVASMSIINTTIVFDKQKFLKMIFKFT